MQIIKKNLKQGEVTIKVNSPEDLWFLSQVIEADDSIKGKTERKIKIGKEDERKQSIVRKSIFLEVKIEKIEFHKYSENLRVGGIILQGPDDVPRGSHHTFNVESGTVITIKKQEWMGYQLEKLKEATQKLKTKILIVLMDREEALFAMLKHQGHEVLTNLKGDVAKKDVDGGSAGGKKNFYTEIIEKLREYNKRFEPQNIIVASPSFWKEYLMKEMPDELKAKITLSTCSDIKETSLQEVLQRPELFKVLESDRAAKELSMLDELLKAISKNEACYGMKECKEKTEIGAVKELLVSYDFLQESRKNNKHREIEQVMKLAEKMKAKVNILSTEDTEKKLVGLGGIAGILRWKTE
ncbi:MAG: mRNA surveillance protein pelota [Nanoarchaeota archaeon]|nr:mRNA surveillance protein pelota [Nanoarchaeota archaeon]MBU1322343.1 mRNA surveillance protein pelota [Nanoarchaeota archaeon]MBU1596979.1 mRNA surveillance protein pelota [Nanoarchaeota archaeon]MBU2441169.1 mRNA surveillance protein pelota [Nanoarchaeota archaeon]